MSSYELVVNSLGFLNNELLQTGANSLKFDVSLLLIFLVNKQRTNTNSIRTLSKPFLVCEDSLLMLLVFKQRTDTNSYELFKVRG